MPFRDTVIPVSEIPLGLPAEHASDNARAPPSGLAMIHETDPGMTGSQPLPNGCLSWRPSQPQLAGARASRHSPAFWRSAATAKGLKRQASAHLESESGR